MIAIPSKPSAKWFASLEFPIDVVSYELLDSAEDADGLIEHVCHIAEVIRKLKADGWKLEFHLGEDDSFYIITHPTFETASEANARLEQLGIRRIHCLDNTALLAE